MKETILGATGNPYSTFYGVGVGILADCERLSAAGFNVHHTSYISQGIYQFREARVEERLATCQAYSKVAAGHRADLIYKSTYGGIVTAAVVGIAGECLPRGRLTQVRSWDTTVRFPDVAARQSDEDHGGTAEAALALDGMKDLYNWQYTHALFYKT